MLCCIFRLSPQQSQQNKQQTTVVGYNSAVVALSVTERATTAELYPGRDTFVFDQGHMTKNQPITVLILLSESLGIQQFKLSVHSCGLLHLHICHLWNKIYHVD